MAVNAELDRTSFAAGQADPRKSAFVPRSRWLVTTASTVSRENQHGGPLTIEDGTAVAEPEIEARVPDLMIKSFATTLLNRLVLLAALLLVVDAYTRTNCSSEDNPFTPIVKTISSLNEIATALQKR